MIDLITISDKLYLFPFPFQQLKQIIMSKAPNTGHAYISSEYKY